MGHGGVDMVRPERDEGPRTRVRRLTRLQERFIDEYVADPSNAAAAALRAGYTPGTASQASMWLKKDRIAAAILRHQNRQTCHVTVSPELVVGELANLATVDPGDILTEDGAIRPMSKWPPHVRRCVAAIKVKEVWEWDAETRKKKLVGHTKDIRFWSKDKALELLAKIVKLIGPSADGDDAEDLAALLAEARERRRAGRVRDVETVDGTPTLEQVDPGVRDPSPGTQGGTHDTTETTSPPNPPSPQD